MKKYLLLLIIICLLIPLFANGQTPQRPMAIYSDAPEFSLLDLKGEIINVSDFKGERGVLLIFSRGWLGDHF